MLPGANHRGHDSLALLAAVLLAVPLLAQADAPPRRPPTVTGLSVGAAGYKITVNQDGSVTIEPDPAAPGLPDVPEPAL